jgi:hypothetical protein
VAALLRNQLPLLVESPDKRAFFNTIRTTPTCYASN